MKKRLFPLMGLLSACSTLPPTDTPAPDESTGNVGITPAAVDVPVPVGDSALPHPATPSTRPSTTPVRKPATTDRSTTEIDVALPPQPAILFPGTGEFAKPTPAPEKMGKKASVTQTPAGDITLSFEGADLRDVIKVIFDTLKENYTIDPQVQGEVTVQTGQPLHKEQLLPTLETLLRMYNAVLVREHGINRIMPATGAVRHSTLIGPARAGYGMRIVPLQYISATEMQTVLAPFLPEGGIVRADTLRNLLVLAGTPQELAHAQHVVDTFDVNWLKGMSVGLFRLRNMDSATMAANLNQLFGEGSGTPIAGIMRFVPLTKINAVIVITPQSAYLKEVGTWVERLDGAGGERLYLYAVQHSRADYMAELLNGLFNLSANTAGNARGGEVAPGLKPTTLTSANTGLGGGGTTNTTNTSTSTTTAITNKSNAMATKNRAGVGAGANTNTGGPSAGMEEVRIVADVENNALLIWATRQNYERILSTLSQMDVPPRQVLIEATIAEVTLSGELQYGLQWFFNNDVGRTHNGQGTLGLSPDANLPKALEKITAGQFSYALTDTGGAIKGLLSTLAGDSKVKVLSSPQVMVVDNQQASIRVGSQQPIPQATVTLNSGATQSGGVDFKDTGVLLDVLPRINAGGMVNLDIKQDVVELGPLDTATKQNTYLQRSVSSKVVVKSGQTVVLGGLIRDNRTDGQSGIPGLYKLPVVGPLFGNTQESYLRTELIVLITPRVVNDNQEAVHATEEMTQKMQAIAPLLGPMGRAVPSH